MMEFSQHFSEGRKEIPIFDTGEIIANMEKKSNFVFTLHQTLKAIYIGFILFCSFKSIYVVSILKR